MTAASMTPTEYLVVENDKLISVHTSMKKFRAVNTCVFVVQISKHVIRIDIVWQ